MEIVIHLTDKSIKNAAKQAFEYAVWVERKEVELRKKLAEIGATVASIRFSRAIRTTDNGITVSVDDNGENAIIRANGEQVCFIEFGAGSRYGYGHPEAGEKGFGPGTYPGKGHWDDPNGWWYGHNKHSYGNPPAMAMYDARMTMAEQLYSVAREVFSHD